MTPEQQRIAIAEFCGWGYRRALNTGTFAWFSPTGSRETFWFWDSPTPCPDGLPNYLNDLNAMHEAEEELDKFQGRHFQERLFKLVNHSDTLHCLNFLAIHATAAQRAEALLRTIGKWKDLNENS